MPHAHALPNVGATPNSNGAEPSNGSRPSLKRYVWLSIGAAALTIGLKTGAWWITGSVGLLSDAIESLVNLVAALLALFIVALSERPPDEEHAYGHTKSEYFSSGIEGGLILVAAAGIAWSAWNRLLNPQALESVGIGLVVSITASAINLAVALILRNAGRRYRSIVLEADSQHLMTDVWTSVGVIVGVALVALTGWLVLDPLIGLLVAANIVWTGIQLMRRSAMGLMDTALSNDERTTIERILAPYRAQGIAFHALRTRQAGTRRFMSVHVLAPGEWSIQLGHSLAEQIESDLRRELPGMVVFTHLEPLEDPAAMEDLELDRV
ncbi:MAG: cation diffusion facilitator family transporter [Caldilineaceae bacterium]